MDFDLVIIGAGIHGSAVAQAAAAAGYRTLVLEQYDQPAQGTSSRSSKLIHGGLRYLESGQFRLVRECLRERSYLLRNAPDLVELVPFHIPVYRDTLRRPWQIRLGLSLYALLGGKSFSKVPRSQWPQLDGLRLNGLQAVFRYYDARTDDEKLTRAVLDSACSLGADIRYGSHFIDAECTHDHCIVRYRQHQDEKEIRARALINAGGPWVNQVLQRIQPGPRPLGIELVQGTHLLLPGKLEQGMYYLEAPQDGRAVFVMPWKDDILLGTTETVFRGDPASVKPLETEIRYLLDVYGRYFDPPADESQVIGSFAGLRVLPETNGEAFHRSRDTLLHIDTRRCPRVLSLYGGKLTSHRASAEQAIQRLAAVLPERERIADTRALRLG